MQPKPAESNAVSSFLKAVDEEQARAGYGVLTARDRALLPGKSQSFVKRLRLFASEKYKLAPKEVRSEQYVILRTERRLQVITFYSM